MIDLPAQFVGRMKNELGGEADEFFASYDLPAAKAIRVNTLKTTVERFRGDVQKGAKRRRRVE